MRILSEIQTRFPQWFSKKNMLKIFLADWVFSHTCTSITSIFQAPWRQIVNNHLFTSWRLDIDCCRKMQRVHANACTCDMWTVKQCSEKFGALVCWTTVTVCFAGLELAKNAGKLSNTFDHKNRIQYPARSFFCHVWARLETVWPALQRQL